MRPPSSSRICAIAAIATLLGSGCSTLGARRPVSADNGSAAAVAAAGSCADRALCRLFVRETPPIWINIRAEGMVLAVPYSTNWSIGGTGLSAYDVAASEPPTGAVAVDFGRPADGFSSIPREYEVRRTGKVSPGIPRYGSGACGDGSSRAIEVGGIKGTEYLDGGATWCSLVFVFDRGRYTYSVSRNLEPYVTVHGEGGSDFTAALDPEMRRIIGSVHEWKSRPTPMGP
jgi:hypothetical protein